MPTTVKRKLSAAEAAKHASVVLGLDDLKRLGIALAEAAAAEASSNHAFAEKCANSTRRFPPRAESKPWRVQT